MRQNGKFNLHFHGIVPLARFALDEAEMSGVWWVHVSKPC